MTKKTFLLFGDLIVLALSFTGTMLIGFGSWESEIVTLHMTPFLFLYLIWLLILYIFNFYDLARARLTVQAVKRFVGMIISAGVVSVLIFYLFPVFSITPKTNLLVNLILFALLFIIWRWSFFRLSRTYLKEPVLFVGESTYTKELFALMDAHPQLGYTPTEIVGDMETAIAQVQRGEVHTIIFDINNGTDTDTQLTKLYTHGAVIYSVSYAYELLAQRIPADTIDLSWFVHHLPQQQSGIWQASTRVLEIFLSALVLLITSPIMALVALGVKISDGGPVFYSQTRLGQYNTPFTLYKFRSMIVDAEKDTGATWAEKKDSRITPIGRIIRKLHLDELPQLWNVLRGDMALVGPRPERPELVTQLADTIPHYQLRHIIPPGFTGWGQIKYRYARSMSDSQRKFEYDLYYIKNKSLWLDLGIIAKTIQIIVTH